MKMYQIVYVLLTEEGELYGVVNDKHSAIQQAYQVSEESGKEVSVTPVLVDEVRYRDQSWNEQEVDDATEAEINEARAYEEVAQWGNDEDDEDDYPYDEEDNYSDEDEDEDEDDEDEDLTPIKLLRKIATLIEEYL